MKADKLWVDLFMRDLDGDWPQSRICHIFKITSISAFENHLLTLLPGLDKAKY
jgi:hypothetical protein